MAATLAAASDPTILPLGDSITRGVGCEEQGGYRGPLQDSLSAHGIGFDFLGPLEDPLPPGYDRDHEGRGGWTAGEVLRGGPGDTTDFRDRLGNLRPDFVLLHLGTNDVGRNIPPESTAADIDSLVTVLRESRSDVRVLVARILPMADPWGLGAGIPALNDTLTALAARLDLVLVNQHTGFDTGADLGDGVHPRCGGYAKMAGRWFAALRPFLEPPPSGAGAPGRVVGRAAAASEAAYSINGRRAAPERGRAAYRRPPPSP